jgi:hypothetical protein
MSNNNWTTANIPDLTGKVVIVTGANSAHPGAIKQNLPKSG